jgi:glucose-1-phosphate adenylyltransferase
LLFRLENVPPAVSLERRGDVFDVSVITPEGKPPMMDGDNFFMRDGIVVIPKDAVIPSGTTI